MGSPSGWWITNPLLAPQLPAPRFANTVGQALFKNTWNLGENFLAKSSGQNPPLGGPLGTHWKVSLDAKHAADFRFGPRNVTWNFLCPIKWNQQSHTFKFLYITHLSYKRMFHNYRASSSIPCNTWYGTFVPRKGVCCGAHVNEQLSNKRAATAHARCVQPRLLSAICIHFA